MGKTPRSGKHASSSSAASTAAAAGGSSHHQKTSSSQQQKVSSTIASMLQELASLVRQTQVGGHQLGTRFVYLYCRCVIACRVRERPVSTLSMALQRLMIAWRMNREVRFVYIHMIDDVWALFTCTAPVSPYFKQKLQGLYHNALQDAKRELAYVACNLCVHNNHTHTHTHTHAHAHAHTRTHTCEHAHTHAHQSSGTSPR